MAQDKKGIGALFDRIAGNYDELNHLFSLNIDKLWRREAVRRMPASAEVLDVAIGTADLTIEILRQGKAQHITGLDLSAEMMRAGEAKTKAKGYDNVTYILGSAQAMPFEPEQFDALLCGYGCRNFANLDEGLSEFHRVLKPGAEAYILEFSMPTNRIIRALYQFYFRHVMTRIGGWISGDRQAYEYFYRSVTGFIWGEEMANRLKQAGFEQVEWKTQTFGISTLYIAKKKK